MIRPAHTHRCGTTLVEILVSVALMGLLLALLIPAVQAMREAARRAQCASKLRQIGIAVNTYQSAHAVLPHNTLFGHAVSLLPYVGEAQRYDEINFNRPAGSEDNFTVFQRSVAIYLCPSQPRPVGYGTIHYPASSGAITDPIAVELFGPYAGMEVRPTDITDGLAHTVSHSEWVARQFQAYNTPEAFAAGDRRSWVFKVPRGLTFATFLDRCRTVPETPGNRFYVLGTDWRSGADGESAFNHLFTPNTKSCSVDGEKNFDHVYTAGSLHPGGVQAVMLDGHVRWVSDGIAPAVWRALGTRGAGDDARF